MELGKLKETQKLSNSKIMKIMKLIYEGLAEYDEFHYIIYCGNTCTLLSTMPSSVICFESERDTPLSLYMGKRTSEPIL